jgi:hypothetical protein
VNKLRARWRSTAYATGYYGGTEIARSHDRSHLRQVVGYFTSQPYGRLTHKRPDVGSSLSAIQADQCA